jgi:hypothetical protein
MPGSEPLLEIKMLAVAFVKSKLTSFLKYLVKIALGTI